MRFDLDNVLQRVVFVFAIIAVVLIAFVAKFDNFTDPDVADYAQIARHVARGEGYTTSAVTPLSLTVAPRMAPHPELGRPPLYTLILAFAMLIGGATDRTVALTSAFFFLATVATTYIIARRHFNDQVAVFGVLVCVLAAPLLSQAISGLETTLLTFLVTLLFGVLFAHDAAEDKHDFRYPIKAGVLLGLCYLTRHETLALAPAVMFYFWLTHRHTRWQFIGITAGCAFAVALPWIIRSSAVAGRFFISLHGYELVMQSDFHPLHSLYRTFFEVPSSPWIDALRHPLDMMKKFNEGLQVLYADVAQLANPFVMPFFVVGILLGAIRRERSTLQWCLLLAIGLQVIALCLYAPLFRILMQFTPMIAILAVAWFCNLMDDYLHDTKGMELDGLERHYRFLALVVWTLLVGYPLTSYIFTSPATPEPSPAAICRELKKQDTGLLATDIPTVAAWYGDKTALLLPQNERELRKLREAGVEPDTVYLSPELEKARPEDGLQEWQMAYAGEDGVLGFRMAEGWQARGRLVLRVTSGAARSSR